MIIVDDDKIRWRNCGIHTFCEELTAALLAREHEHDSRLGFYVRKESLGKLGDVPYMIRKPLHKLFFRDSRIDLWHSTFQLRAVIPSCVPVVQTIHDLNYLYDDIPHSKRERIRRGVARCIRKASHIVAISQFVKDDVLSHFDVGDKPVSVIYNGCNAYDGRVEPPRDVPDRPFLFFIGGISWKKNIQVLPCLLSGNNLELIIAGSQTAPERAECIAEIMKEAAEWGVQDRVHIVGPIPRSVKYWYYHHCEALVFPSLAEGFGLPVIEAMQHGKPVFISDRTSLPEIGGQLAYIFNHDFDRKTMIQEFKQGMSDFRSRPDMAELLRRHAARFTWDEAARQYWNIYEELLKNK